MKIADRQPVGAAHLYGGVYVKEILTPDAFTVIPQHSHHYDHLSYLAAGSVMVRRAGEIVGVFDAPSAIRIPAGEKHSFTTLQPMTLILCIHSVALGEADFHETDLIAEEHHLVPEES
jgi:quercetin dioxygenase-like cupin family protein